MSKYFVLKTFFRIHYHFGPDSALIVGCSRKVQERLSGTSVWRPQSRYTVSRIECRIKFPQNQRCRAKIATLAPNQGVAPFSGPPCRTFLSFAAGRECVLVEGIAALLGSENGSRYRGVSQLQSHQSRYSVQLRGAGALPQLFRSEKRGGRGLHGTPATTPNVWRFAKSQGHGFEGPLPLII